MGTVFRSKYYGLIKNKRGMEAWTGKLICNCDVECIGVMSKTGLRERDPWYDGGFTGAVLIEVMYNSNLIRQKEDICFLY